MRKNIAVFFSVFLLQITFTCLLQADQLTVSKAEGDAVHITQFYSATYNPTGPAGSNNCGPASLSMCLRVLGYFNNFYVKYNDTNQLTPEEQVDHARYLLYPGLKTGSVLKAGTEYNLVNRDGELTNIETYGAGAIRSIGGYATVVSGQTEMDKRLANGIPVLLGGFITTNWKNQFSPQGHGNGSGYHYIAVTGRTNTGLYVVNDPLYRYGANLLTYSQLTQFLGNGSVAGIAFYYRPPAPFIVKKNNSLVSVFMWNYRNQLIYRSVQTAANGVFGAWAPVSTIITTANPAAIEQPNDRLLVFTRGAAHNVLMFTEDVYGNFTQSTDFQGETYYDIAVAKNLDGRVEFFARGIDGKVYKQQQGTVNGNFTGWSSLEGNMRTGPSALQLNNGCIQVFGGYTGNSTQLAYIRQTAADGGWQNAWTGLDGHIKARTTVFRSPDDGYGYAYVRSPSEDCLYYKTQQDNWYSWQVAGGDKMRVFGQPAAGTYHNYDPAYGATYNDQALFVRGADNVIYWSYLKRRNGVLSWVRWDNAIDGIAASEPAAGNFADGRLFVTVRGTTGYIYYRIQQGSTGGWADWQVLGSSLQF